MLCDISCCNRHDTSSEQMFSHDLMPQHRMPLHRVSACAIVSVPVSSDSVAVVYRADSTDVEQRPVDVDNDSQLASCASSSAAGGRREWQPDSVRKLFDKELDNHHEEKLLLAQVMTSMQGEEVGD